MFFADEETDGQGSTVVLAVVITGLVTLTLTLTIVGVVMFALRR